MNLRSLPAAAAAYLYQLTETGLSAPLTLGATKFFKDDDLH